MISSRISAAQPSILDREDDLDPAVEVPLHQVGAAKIDLVLSAVAEVVDAAVLEEAADDADHPDVLAPARHARPQAAAPRTMRSILTPACDAA